MKPVFWKLSMGPGSSGGDFKNVLEVVDCIRHGLVLVHKDTKPMGRSATSQGSQFTDPARFGEYFYLCHGNADPAIILLGQFSGPANVFSARGEGWADRPFRWIQTSKSAKKFKGEQKRWAPNNNSTFIRVPDDEVEYFEEAILQPYFEYNLTDFEIEV